MFRAYVADVATGRQLPHSIPGSASNGWTGSWKKHFLEFAHLHALYALYPNFPNQMSFSTNHLEPGEHVASNASRLDHRPQDFTVPLWPAAPPHFFPQLAAWPPSLASLPQLNVFGDVVPGK
jgi:hypothetical protein